MASEMELSDIPAETHKHVPSLAEQAEQKIFEELSKHIQNETKQSTFAVGGSIQITSLDGHLVCESDYAASDGGNEPESEASKRHDSGEGEGSLGPVLSNEYSNFPLDRGAFGMADTDHSPTWSANTNVERSAIAEITSHRMRCDPITIRWDSTTDTSSSRKVTLPLSDNERPIFEQLLKDCQPASFGRGGEDVLDETYRKAGKLDELDFCTNFSPYALGIVETAAQALVLNNRMQKNETHGIRAELYKLNIYAAPSGMFKAHVDTPRSKHQIGSLVVCLPHFHEGGQLVLRHQGRENVFDWSGEKSRNAIQWAAFYSDCEHEVFEVTAGERITLTYNLYATCSANRALIDPEQAELYHTMKTLLEQPGFCKNGATLGYHCAHAYPHTSKETIATLPATLKGVDKVVHACLTATNHPVRLRHLLEYSDIDMEYNDTYRGLLQMAPKSQLPRLAALLEHYHQIPDKYRNEQTNTQSHYLWQRIDDPNLEKRIDVAVLSDKLVPFKFTEIGLGGEEGDAIVWAWTRDFSVENVKWLNKPSHQELALVHGAFGNEASIDKKYSRLVIILEIPPFSSR